MFHHGAFFVVKNSWRFRGLFFVLTNSDFSWPILTFLDQFWPGRPDLFSPVSTYSPGRPDLFSRISTYFVSQEGSMDGTPKLRLSRVVLQNSPSHVLPNRVQWTVSGNTPSQYSPDATNWTLRRCSLRGLTVSSKPYLETLLCNILWTPPARDCWDTLGKTL